MIPPQRDALPRGVATLATAAVALIATVQLILIVVRPESGIPGLLQVLSPHMTLVALALTPLSLLRGTRRLRLDLLLLAVICVVRFGGEWVSLPRPVPDGGLTVTSWNLEVGARSAAESVETLRSIDADVVLIQELGQDVSEAIEADADLASRYPNRVLEPATDLTGMGVLSRHPLTDAVLRTGPMVQELLVDVDGRPVRLANAHPFPAPFGERFLGVPVGFDPSRRNAHVASIRASVDRWIDAGEAVVLGGDFNTAPSEPAFGRLVGGLHDAHAEVGLGTGWTWRPSRLDAIGLGLLRLDLVLTGPGLQPVWSDVRCPPAGDHCIVTAGLAWTEGP